MLLTDQPDTGTLAIAGCIDISAADELRDALREHIARYPEPSLDLAGVEACDAAVLQLLWAARRTAAHANKPLRVTAWSAAVREAGSALAVPFDELDGEPVRGI